MKNVRAYVLLDVRDREADIVVKTLRAMSGVVTAELIEGPPDVMAVLEAPETQSLARLTVKALKSVEKFTLDMRLLPVRQDTGPNATLVAVHA